jgi:hypothetical protein
MLLNWLNNFFITIFVPGWISSVFWNVVVGLFGIYFTVYFVDRRAKKREEKKNKPARDYVYSQLVNLINSFYQEVTPIFPVGEDRLEWWKFGEAWGIINNFYQGLDENQCIQKLTKLLESQKTLQVEDYEEIFTQLDGILAQSTYLFDPELLRLLAQLKGDIDVTRHSIRMSKMMGVSRSIAVGFLSRIIIDALPVLEWLRLRTDEVKTSQENNGLK